MKLKMICCHVSWQMRTWCRTGAEGFLTLLLHDWDDLTETECLHFLHCPFNRAAFCLTLNCFTQTEFALLTFLCSFTGSWFFSARPEWLQYSPHRRPYLRLLTTVWVEIQLLVSSAGCLLKWFGRVPCLRAQQQESQSELTFGQSVSSGSFSWLISHFRRTHTDSLCCLKSQHWPQLSIWLLESCPVFLWRWHTQGRPVCWC